MLAHLDIPPQELYDGLEDGLYTRTFRLPVGDVSFSLDDLGRFEELRDRIGDAAFEQVIAEAGIQRRWHTYKGVHDLPVECLVRDGYLFVLAIGERSAGRFYLELQGAWSL